ncbi:unnamed protein product, partial [Mesorhabditis spiculigera]
MNETDISLPKRMRSGSLSSPESRIGTPTRKFRPQRRRLTSDSSITDDSISLHTRSKSSISAESAVNMMTPQLRRRRPRMTSRSSTKSESNCTGYGGSPDSGVEMSPLSHWSTALVSRISKSDYDLYKIKPRWFSAPKPDNEEQKGGAKLSLRALAAARDNECYDGQWPERVSHWLKGAYSEDECRKLALKVLGVTLPAKQFRFRRDPADFFEDQRVPKCEWATADDLSDSMLEIDEAYYDNKPPKHFYIDSL